MRLTIRTKLYAGFGTMALLTLALGVFAVLGLYQFDAAQETVYVDSFGGSQLLARYIERAGYSQTLVPRYLADDSSQNRDRLKAEIKAVDAELAALRKQMDEADTDRQEVQTLEALTAAWNDFASWRDDKVLGAPTIDVAKSSYNVGAAEKAESARPTCWPTPGYSPSAMPRPSSSF